MKIDGSEYQRITNDESSRWRPFPTPDGKHILFNKVVAPRNYEIYLMDLDTRKETRLTFDDGFDGYPSVSSDGRTMSYSSMRGNAPNDHGLYIHLMDISKLNLGRKWRRW